jgi:hypothetical protein
MTPSITSENNISNIFLPSVFPNKEEQALSGCGIIPNTFLASLHMPAMFRTEPFGFASGTTLPSSSQ